MPENWVILTLMSACCLGFYDISKKHSVNGNAVMPVLFFATLSGTLFFTIFSAAFGTLPPLICPLRDFGLIVVKSVIVASSWICVYNAMKVMPISLAAPIRSTAPLWTLIGSLALYHEIPTVLQALGMLTIFIGYYLFSVWGRLEGFALRSRGMLFILCGTAFGAVSSLYDKYLLNSLHLDRGLVQFHFSVMLVVIFGTIALLQRHRQAFEWRWSIPSTGIALIVADWLYFYAVSLPDIHISVVSLMRRSNVLVAFGLGVWLFHEQHVTRKAWSLLLILLGTVLLSLS